MFTGIIQSVGSIQSAQTLGDDLKIGINTGALPLDDFEQGESIAVNGVCLTALAPLGGALTGVGFYADVSVETLRLTTASQWGEGMSVNLERSLQAQSRLGGHFVSGHVDAIGTIKAIQAHGRSYCYQLYYPSHLRKYIAVKGSICVDGVSLTVNAVNGEYFELTIIPHSFEQTIFKHYVVGTQVNLEVDSIARYLEQLINFKDSP